MNFFEEINNERKDFPVKNSITDEFSRHTFNFYQFTAVGLFILFFFLGIFFGNLFATCQATSYFFSTECLVTEFNFAVMICVWFVGFILSLFIFAIGHIIQLLREISQKLSKLK